MPSIPTSYGLPSAELEVELRATINQDYTDRDRDSKALDVTLMQKLDAVCAKDFSDPQERICAMRRFLTCRYGMLLDVIDPMLATVVLSANVPDTQKEMVTA